MTRRAASPATTRPATAAVLALACAALLVAGCESRGPVASPQVQPQELPPIKQQEATPRYKAELRTELAAGYFDRGQYDVSLEELAEAIKFDPTYAKIYSIYGLVYTELGDDPKAEANFRRGLELAPGDSEIRQNWGWYLCTHGKPRDAIAEFEAAIANPLYRTPEIALINAGKCSVQIGDTAAADRYLSADGQAIVQIDPREFKELPLQQLALTDKRRYGSTLLCFYQRAQATNDELRTTNEE